MIGLLLLTGCSRESQSRPTAALDPVQEAMAAASAAAEALQEAADRGDHRAAQIAYEEMRVAFGRFLGPVSVADMSAARQMVEAHSVIRKMMAEEELDATAIRREVAEFRQGLMLSVAVMAQGPAASEPPAETARLMPAAGPEQTITVVAVDYRFQPNRLTVRKGTRVTIRFENRGTERHEFEIEDLDFEIGPIQPGQVAEKSFVAEKVGVYPYECHVEDHLQRGMRGILEVVE